MSGRRQRPAYIVVRSGAKITRMILFGANDWNSSGTTSWNYEWTSPSRVGPQGVETPACPARECPPAIVSPEHRARQRTTKPPARPQRNQCSSQADLGPNQHTLQPRPSSSSVLRASSLVRAGYFWVPSETVSSSCNLLSFYTRATRCHPPPQIAGRAASRHAPFLESLVPLAI